MRSIFNYIISLILCLGVYSAQAQEIQGSQAKFWNGVTIQADVASVVQSTFFRGDANSMEGGVQIDLKHMYYPIVEMGFADAKNVSTNNIGFTTKGIFERVGFDLKIVRKECDKQSHNMLFTGLRLGMSHFDYNINNVTITDNYWGGTKTFDYPTQNTTKLWFEIVLGIRVEVFRNVYMGWTVRNKNLISKDKNGEVSPWYIPGFGKNNVANWGFNYTIGYHF